MQVDANLQGVTPSQGISAVPKGWYPVMVTKSEVKLTQAGTGKFLALVYTIAQGTFQGRNLYDNFNIINPSQTAVAIALGQLAAVCKAVNFVPPGPSWESSQLHNILFMVRVKVDNNDQNSITEWLSVPDFTAKYPDEAASLGMTTGAGFTPPGQAGGFQIPPAGQAPTNMPPVAQQAAPPAFMQQAPQQAAFGQPPAFNQAPQPTTVPPFMAQQPQPSPQGQLPPFMQGQPPVQQPEVQTPQFQPPQAQATPAKKVWLSHSSVNNGTPELRPETDIVALIQSGVTDALVMSEDQSSGWVSPGQLGIMAPAAQQMQPPQAQAIPSGMPLAAAPWGRPQ